MHESASVGQTVGKMRLIAAKGMRALHRSPLPPPIPDHDIWRRRPSPAGAAPLSLHRFVRGHLIRGMSELEDALLLHPIDEIRIDLCVTTKKILLHLRLFDDDVLPRLRIRAGHCPASGFEDPGNVFVGNWIWLEFPNAGPAPDDVVEKVVTWR